MLINESSKLNMIKKVSVFCASSRQVDPVYFDAAYRLGEVLGKNGITILYGGGAVGLMGHLADGTLNSGGEIIGIIPRFMYDLEWGNPKIKELVIVETLHERKKMLAHGVDAVIALPGGCGTFEELMEVITLKRLGFYTNPIIIVNINGFYDPLIRLLENSIDERFMDERHREMWSVVDTSEEVLNAIYKAPQWYDDAVKFAAI